MDDVNIRFATAHDATDILNIYAPYVVLDTKTVKEIFLDAVSLVKYNK